MFNAWVLANVMLADCSDQADAAITQAHFKIHAGNHVTLVKHHTARTATGSCRTVITSGLSAYVQRHNKRIQAGHEGCGIVPLHKYLRTYETLINTP